METIDKKTIMEDTIAKIRNKMPDELLGKYSEMDGAMDVERLSTGSIAIDTTIGGGLPKGRLIQIVGKASSGKTTLCLVTIAQLQKEKPDANILYVDAENALDPEYAASLGVNMDNIYLVQPSNGENGYEIAAMFIESGVADLVVIDSIPAMIPKAMLEYELDEQPKIALGATLDTRGIARIFTIANKTKCTVLLINQYRERVTIGMPTQGDGVSGSGYLPGGQSLPFYMSQILKIQRVGKIYDGDNVVGDQVRLTSIKNKVGKPYATVDFYTSYGNGISIADEILEYGEKYGYVFKTARTYALIDKEATEAARKENPDADEIIVEGSRKSGRQNFINYLNEDKKRLEELKVKIQNQIKEEQKGSPVDADAVAEAEGMGADK